MGGLINKKKDPRVTRRAWVMGSFISKGKSLLTQAPTNSASA